MKDVSKICLPFVTAEPGKEVQTFSELVLWWSCAIEKSDTPPASANQQHWYLPGRDWATAGGCCLSQWYNSKLAAIGFISSIMTLKARFRTIGEWRVSQAERLTTIVHVQVITQSPTCELRILSATPEQISQLQDTQEIILSEEQILAPASVSLACSVCYWGALSDGNSFLNFHLFPFLCCFFLLIFSFIRVYSPSFLKSFIALFRSLPLPCVRHG